MTQPTGPATGQPPAPTAPPAHPIPTPTPPAPPAPAPAPVPQPPAPAPAPTPAPAPGQVPGMQQQPPGMGDDLPYFQEGVPWRQLPPEQQTAYWMHKARTHESRTKAMSDYDQLKADQQRYQELLTTTQTERERDIAAARRQGETEAMGRANVMLVEAYVRSAAAARGVDEDAVADFLETVNLNAFVTNGQVDTAKVYRQVNRMTPATLSAPAAGVPAAPAVPVAPAQQVPQVPAAVPAPPAGWPQQPGYGQPVPQQVPGQPAGAPNWYGQQPTVPSAPAWPGQVPAAPVAAGQPGAAGGPDFGQGQYTQAPPSGLEAGKAAARARFGDRANSAKTQAA